MTSPATKGTLVLLLGQWGKLITDLWLFYLLLFLNLTSRNVYFNGTICIFRASCSIQGCNSYKCYCSFILITENLNCTHLILCTIKILNDYRMNKTSSNSTSHWTNKFLYLILWLLLLVDKNLNYNKSNKN